MTFYLGDIVEWISGKEDSRCRKRGEVVCVIPPGVSLGVALKTMNTADYNLEKIGYFRFLTRTRPHENYLVAVKSTLKGAKRRPMLYRPAVSKLAHVGVAIQRSVAHDGK